MVMWEMLTLRHVFNLWVKSHSGVAVVILVSTYLFVNIPACANATPAVTYEVGVESGDWIEYELNWTVPPPGPYSVEIRREILDVKDTVITVEITQQMSNGSVISEIKEGDIWKGTGAAAMVFIPPNSESGDLVNIEGLGSVRINGTTQRTYLGIERTVLWADFSSHGINIHIFWDKEKGVALEIYHSSTTAQGTTKIMKTNLWKSGSDGIGDIPYIINENNQDRYPLVNPWTPTPPTPDFSISASPTSLTIPQGNSDTSTITITSIGGFDQPVELSVSGAPSGVTATLNPEQVTPALDGSTTSTLTVSVETTATLGSYTLTVTGTTDTVTHTADIVLEIMTASQVTAAIDELLLNLIDQYATSHFNSAWDITLDQYKAWIATIAWGESGKGGYVAHSQRALGSDVFNHRTMGSNFRFSTGIGPFQLDRGGEPDNWHYWSTIKKLNLEEAVKSVLGWHYRKFGANADLEDFADNSVWFAVNPIEGGNPAGHWEAVTGTSWDIQKKGKVSLDWSSTNNQLFQNAEGPGFRYNTNVKDTGTMRWNIKESEGIKTDTGKKVVFDGDYQTWLITARNWDGIELFQYYYTYDQTRGIEVWVWNNYQDPVNNLRYIFVREYTTGPLPEHTDRGVAGEALTSPAIIENHRPICIISLLKDGVEVSGIDVGQFLDIYVWGSADDAGIEQVRFSSDEVQDGNPAGEWTEWYNWDISLGDWDASTKIKRWAFATGGDKEVWAEVKDDIGQTDQDYADIFVHPGYAIIVAGKGRWWAFKEDLAICHCANNAYRALRNLGFNDDHIYYLNSHGPQDVDGDGDDEVDALALVTHFNNSLNDIKARTNGNPSLLVTYLVGHGDEAGFLFDPYCDCIGGEPGCECHLSATGQLKGMLNEFSSETRILVFINSCYSGYFITSSSGSISGPNSIMVTSTHDDQERYAFVWVRSSDRFWGGLNKALSVKEAFTYRPTPGDNSHMWLDDSGDKIGHPPNDLQDDGELAAVTKIGIPGTENLALTPWQLIWKRSPGELRVYDSQNRVTGLVNGTVKEEIPDSIYDEDDEIVSVFSSYGAYRYEVVGTETGTYGLDIASIEDGDAITFTATDILTSTNATHQYSVDWDALSQGLEGVTVQVDFNGDGAFEKMITADDELTQQEFTILTDMTKPVADAGSNRTVNVGVVVTFDAGGSSDSVGIVKYHWNFGDGTNGTGSIANHTYTEPGKYAVTLTVLDAADNSDADSITVIVLSTLVFPMWLVGAAVAIIAIASAAIAFWQYQKRKGTC